MIELYNALKNITLLFSIQKILTFNLGVAFLKSVSIFTTKVSYLTTFIIQMYSR